jgi:hypothetical protein
MSTMLPARSGQRDFLAKEIPSREREREREREIFPARSGKDSVERLSNEKNKERGVEGEGEAKALTIYFFTARCRKKVGGLE